ARNHPRAAARAAGDARQHGIHARRAGGPAGAPRRPPEPRGARAERAGALRAALARARRRPSFAGPGPLCGRGRQLLNFPEVAMNPWLKSILAATALAAATSPAFAQGDEASVEKRLADAQRRLEEAAREVAELSGEAGGPAGMPQFEYFLGGPRRAMLGVNIDGTEPNGGGVRVGGVSPGGPAAEAGVKAGDVIVSVQSKPVATGRELVHVMETVKPGEKVELGLKRDGKPLKLAVEARPLDNVFFTAPALPALPAIPAIPELPAIAALAGDGDAHWLLEDWGDAEFVTLTPGLGHYFAADKGVLVARAPEDAS